MKRTYKHLSIEERCELKRLHADGRAFAEIGRHLGRSSSTIIRELRRNKSKSGDYKPSVAERRALGRRHQGHYKLDREKEVKCYVLEKLGQGWSPHAIAGRFCYEEKPARVCGETIYEYIYHSPFGIKHELYLLLARNKPRRTPKRSRKCRLKIRDRISIHLRPEAINQRQAAGHLEADLVLFGRNSKQNLITLIDRKTRLLTIIHNLDGKKATNVMQKIEEKLSNTSVKSVTFDNGLEFAKHTQLRLKGIDTFFCDPYSSWQKGSIENANGIIRRFFPRSCDPNLINDNSVEYVQNIINNIPRKILGFQTPAEFANRCTST